MKFEPQANTKRLRLRARLCEEQRHRCAICTSPIEVISYSNSNERACVVAFDKSLPKNYLNSVVVCNLCSGRSSYYDNLSQLYEAYQAGIAFDQKEKLSVVYEETIGLIRNHLRELFPLHGLEYTDDYIVPKGFRFAPPHVAPTIAMQMVKRQMVVSKAADRSKFGRNFKRRLLEAQNHRCCYCGTSMRTDMAGHPRYATWEHVDALGDGGKNRMKNLVMACYVCNFERSRLKLNAYEFSEWAKRNGDNIETAAKRLLVNHGNKSHNGFTQPLRPLYDYS